MYLFDRRGYAYFFKSASECGKNAVAYVFETVLEHNRFERAAVEKRTEIVYIGIDVVFVAGYILAFSETEHFFNNAVEYYGCKRAALIKRACRQRLQVRIDYNRLQRLKVGE